MESPAECSEYDSDNNNNRDESKTTTTTTTTTTEDDTSALPLPVPVLLLSSVDPVPSPDLPEAELFAADPTFMEALTEEHGYSELAARKALYWTRNESLASGSNSHSHSDILK